MKRKRCNDCTLDISSPNDKLVYHKKRKSNNVLEWYFHPKERVELTRVCDDKGLICECEGSVTFVRLSHRYKKPYLLSVDVNGSKMRFFLKADDRWKEITIAEYVGNKSYLSMLANPDKHFKIDVNKAEDMKYCDIKNHNYGDVKQIQFCPRIGYYVRAVVDGEQTIWKPEDDSQKCINVRATYNRSRKKLLQVMVCDIKDTKWKYWQRVKSKWVERKVETFIEDKVIGCKKNGVKRKHQSNKR